MGISRMQLSMVRIGTGRVGHYVTAGSDDKPYDEYTSADILCGRTGSEYMYVTDDEAATCKRCLKALDAAQLHELAREELATAREAGTWEPGRGPVAPEQGCEVLSRDATIDEAALHYYAAVCDPDPKVSADQPGTAYHARRKALEGMVEERYPDLDSRELVTFWSCDFAPDPVADAARRMRELAAEEEQVRAWMIHDEALDMNDEFDRMARSIYAYVPSVPNGSTATMLVGTADYGQRESARFRSAHGKRKPSKRRG